MNSNSLTESRRDGTSEAESSNQERVRTLWPPNKKRLRSFRTQPKKLQTTNLIAGRRQLSAHDLLNLQVEALGNALAIRRVRLEEMPDLPFLNFARRIRQAAHDVADQPLLRIGGIRRKRLPGWV